ncbi:MAG: DinB family protein [Bryobacteraceae bacterium]
MPLPPRKSEGPLNPEIERLLYQVKVVREDGAGLLDGLSEEQAQWAPAQGQWSMVQCFEHLNVSNEKLLSQFRAAVADARQRGILGDGPFVYGWLGRWFLKLMAPPVKRRFKAPAAFQPGPRKTLAEVREQWESSHEELDKVIRSANGLDLARVKVTSPAASFLRYSLGVAFWILTAHDRRHIWQARQVRNAAGFPATAATSSAK